MAGIILYNREAKRWEAWGKSGTKLVSHDSDLTKLAFRYPRFKLLLAAVRQVR